MPKKKSAAPPRGKPPSAVQFSHQPYPSTRGYPGQVDWINAALRHKVVVIAVGRQAGKTSFLKFLAMQEASRHHGFYNCAYTAQGHAQASEMYEQVLADFEPSGLIKKARDKGQDRWAEFIPFGANTGMKWYFWSFDPDAHVGAQGKSLHRGMFDEAGLCPEEAWSVTMRPMFNATQGKAVVIGSPVPGGIGFAWFEKIWELGNPANPRKHPDYLSFNAPSECNPFATLEDIKLGRLSCRSRSDELCLYDGQFAKDTGAVFTNLAAVFALNAVEERPGCWVYRRPREGERCCAGLDFGKHADATVLSIFSLDTAEQLALVTLREMPYAEQFERVVPLLDEFACRPIYADGRDGGAMLTEFLRARYGEGCVVVKWTQGGKWDKASAVVRGQDLCQSAGWKLIDCEFQREEFRLFSKEPMGEHSSGWRYSAPPGKHDDAVTAALYAAYGLPLVRKAAPQLVTGPKPHTAEWYEWVRDSQRLGPSAGNPFVLRR